MTKYKYLQCPLDCKNLVCMGGFYVCIKNIKIEECTKSREVWQCIKILGFKQNKKIGMTTDIEV